MPVKFSFLFFLISENIKLSKIMNDIDSVSKKMEKEKKLQSRKNRYYVISDPIENIYFSSTLSNMC